jgi:iron(III) transport system ATP-binding protein
VALARALAPEPKLLLLDEPFANVDSALRKQLGESLRDILLQEKASALLVTHDRNDAISLSDRLAIMGMADTGAIIDQIGDPETVYKNPSSPESADMTGECLFFEGIADGKRADTPLGSFSLSVERQGKVLIIARPEQLKLLEDPEGPLLVKKLRFKGARWEISCGHGKKVYKIMSSVATLEGAKVKIVNRTPLWALSR